MCGDTAARAADPTLLILALEIFSAGENPIFAMWQPREEVAEPEGQAGPGGTSLFQEHIPVPTGDTHPCSHPSWQGSEVCSRCARGAPARQCPRGLGPKYSLLE